jgi:hypothetical protein
MESPPKIESTKPSKPSSVGFEGATLSGSPIIRKEIDTPGVSWAEWKAAALNRAFQEQGTSGQPGCIVAATVEHSELTNAKRADK